jgi:hypothetical protein
MKGIVETWDPATLTGSIRLTAPRRPGRSVLPESLAIDAEAIASAPAAFEPGCEVSFFYRPPGTSGLAARAERVRVLAPGEKDEIAPAADPVARPRPGRAAPARKYHLAAAPASNELTPLRVILGIILIVAGLGLKTLFPRHHRRYAPPPSYRMDPYPAVPNWVNDGGANGADAGGDEGD